MATKMRDLAKGTNPPVRYNADSSRISNKPACPPAPRTSIERKLETGDRRRMKSCS